MLAGCCANINVTACYASPVLTAKNVHPPVPCVKLVVGSPWMPCTKPRSSPSNSFEILSDIFTSSLFTAALQLYLSNLP